MRHLQDFCVYKQVFGTKPTSLEFGSEHGLWTPRLDLRLFTDKTQKNFVEKMANQWTRDAR